MTTHESSVFQALVAHIKTCAHALGFVHVGIGTLDTQHAHERLGQWLANQYEGDMSYLRTRAEIRKTPTQLVENAQRAICVALPYVPESQLPLVLNRPISAYAQGRDYHKVMRAKLKQLKLRILTYLQTQAGSFPAEYVTAIQNDRVFCDSAPVFEVEFATQAGIGWRGKHTLLIHPKAGSLFFLGEIITSLPLPVDSQMQNHCGRCTKCLDICPTRAFISPYVLDARRCISYLTIEHDGEIDESLRPLMGQHIYGCDDCQVVCPWNKFAVSTQEPDFMPRHKLDQVNLSQLLEFFDWDEATFEQTMQGSAILRIGHARWLRNIATALGNYLAQNQPDSSVKEMIIKQLEQKKNHPVAWVRAHVEWALRQKTCDITDYISQLLR